MHRSSGKVENGEIADIRIALGSVAPSVIRATKTENTPSWQTTRCRLAIEAARAALAAEIAPIDDIRSTARYRSQISQNLLQEFLQSVAPKDERARSDRPKQARSRRKCRRAVAWRNSHSTRRHHRRLAPHDDVPSGRRFTTPEKISSCRASWTLTSTSTSPAAPTGKDSRRHACRCSGRNNDVDRNAAQQHPCHDDGLCISREARCCGGKTLGRYWILGRRGSRKFAGTWARCGSEGVFGFKCFLVPSGVEEFPARDRRRSARGNASASQTWGSAARTFRGSYHYRVREPCRRQIAGQ